MLLELSGIAKRFGGLEVIRRMDFGVETGEIVGLIGPNGAGKSTLVHAVAELARQVLELLTRPLHRMCR